MKLKNDATDGSFRGAILFAPNARETVRYARYETAQPRRNGVTNKEINKFFGKPSLVVARAYGAIRRRSLRSRGPQSKTGTADSRYLTGAVLIFRAATHAGRLVPSRGIGTRSSRRRESRGSVRRGRRGSRAFRRESSDESLD